MKPNAYSSLLKQVLIHIAGLLLFAYTLSAQQAQHGVTQRTTGNIMRIHDITAAPGDQILVKIEIINQVAFNVFQLDIPIPPGFQILIHSGLLNPARAQGHFLAANMLPGTNIFRALAFSMMSLPFLGNSGVVATYTMNTPQTAGVYTLAIQNVMLGDALGQNIPASTINGTVTLIAGPPQNYTATGPQVGCFDALQTITMANANVPGGDLAGFRAGVNIVASAFTVQNNAMADLKAGTSILLGQGVQFAGGSTVHLDIMTTITYCAKSTPIAAANNEELISEEKLLPGDASEMLFSVFPNPATGSITLLMKEMESTSLISVEIYSMRGERVMQQQLFGQQQHEFDLSALPCGIYLARVLNGDSVGVEKIIKQ